MVRPGDEPLAHSRDGSEPRRRGASRLRRRGAHEASGAGPAEGRATERGERPLLTFRLDPALWQDVRERLAVDGRTLSDVVNQGLTAYAGDVATEAKHESRRRRREVGTRQVDLTLPSDISDNLQVLRAEGRGKLLSATLAHLHDIGWPLRTLADALGISRQAVQARVRQDVPIEIRASVGDLDVPPTFPRQRQPLAPGVRRRPSTVQVDLELRARARARAGAEGLSLTQVVEGIVRRYLDEESGAGVAPGSGPLGADAPAVQPSRRLSSMG